MEGDNSDKKGKIEYPLPAELSDFKGHVLWHRVDERDGKMPSKDSHMKTYCHCPVAGTKQGHIWGQPLKYVHPESVVMLEPGDTAHGYQFNVTCTNAAKLAKGRFIFSSYVSNKDLKRALKDAEALQEGSQKCTMFRLRIVGEFPLFPYENSVVLEVYVRETPANSEKYRIEAFCLEDEMVLCAHPVFLPEVPKEFRGQPLVRDPNFHSLGLVSLFHAFLAVIRP